jgi:hypothetical protein
MNEEELIKRFDALTWGNTLSREQVKVYVKFTMTMINKTINLTDVIRRGDHSLTYQMLTEDVLELLDSYLKQYK